MKLLQQDNTRLQLEHESEVRKLQHTITRMEIDVQNLTSAQASMAKANDMNSVFNAVVAQSRRLTNADRATLFLLDSKRKELFSRVAEGSKGEIRIKMNAGLVGVVVTTQAVLNIPLPYEDSRFNPAFDVPVDTQQKIF